jgi:hypothetical protein
VFEIDQQSRGVFIFKDMWKERKTGVFKERINSEKRTASTPTLN